jgi:carbonic anhydrase/acetyltransferase-like protein (isoleucine patch superfamily)
VLDGAVVEAEAIVAAGAVLSPGKRVRRRELWAGCPAKLVRAVKPEELAFMQVNAPNYCELASEYLTLRRSLGAVVRTGLAAGE